MPVITSRARYYFGLHGWPESDIDYVEENADEIFDEDGWAMAVGHDLGGTTWLFPVSESDTFPLSLWKKIKWFIENDSSVIIPMSKNMDKVEDGAKRYNGFLMDNLYVFGDELKGLKKFKGGPVWSITKN